MTDAAPAMIAARLGLGCVLTPAQLARPAELDRAALRTLLLRHGAVLWRGYDFGVDDFRALTERYTADFDDYRGGGMRMPGFDRQAVGAGGTTMTTSGARQGFALPLHGELYYNGASPDLVWFCCLQPPRADGQTTLAWATAVFDALAPADRAYFADCVLAYEHDLPDGLWRMAFQTDAPGVAARLAAQRGLEFSYERARDAVHTRYLTRATRPDPVSGRPGFINSALVVHVGEWAFRSGWVQAHVRPDAPAAAPLVVRGADGARLPERAMDAALRAAEAATADLDWRAGDVLLVDNRRVMHGRRACADPARRIVVRMGRLLPADGERA